jgi:hypothetical protein
MCTYVDIMARFRELLEVPPTDLVLDFFDITFLRDGVIDGAPNRLGVRFLELNPSCACPSGMLPVMLSLALAAQKVVFAQV